jgi:hypothetical protein
VRWKKAPYKQILDIDDNLICTCVNKKDMDLIAAAPEMYVTLKQCRYILDKIASGMGYDLMTKIVDGTLKRFPEADQVTLRIRIDPLSEEW